jgi:hypothetical protein
VRYFVLTSFTFVFVHHLQTAEDIIFLVIFHSGLDGTIILYTQLACLVTKTEIRQAIRNVATFGRSDFCIVTYFIA